MSELSGLKLINAKRPSALAPIQVRRNKLIAKLTEQIALATAMQNGTVYAPMRMRNIKNGETGELHAVEVAKRVRQWFFKDANGKLVIQLRYGSKVMEFAKGKNSVEVSDDAALITVFQTLKSAVANGELDQQISSAADAIKARFRSGSQ